MENQVEFDNMMKKFPVIMTCAGMVDDTFKYGVFELLKENAGLINDDSIKVFENVFVYTFLDGKEEGRYPVSWKYNYSKSGFELLIKHLQTPNKLEFLSRFDPSEHERLYSSLDGYSDRLVSINDNCLSVSTTGNSAHIKNISFAAPVCEIVSKLAEGLAFTSLRSSYNEIDPPTAEEKEAMSQRMCKVY